MRKVVAIALMAGGVLLAQGPRGGMGFGGPGSELAGTLMRGAAVTGAPFSAVQVTTHQQTLANGNTIQREEQGNLFRDSQGRIRYETTWTGANGQAGRSIVTIFDPAAQTVRRLDPQSKTFSETPIRRPQAGAARPSAAGRQGFRDNSANSVWEDLGTRTVNGVPATGRQVRTVVPAGTMGNALPIQRVRETWVSTDLDVPVTIKTSDPRFGSSVTQLTGITRGEPDAALFQTPADYTVTQGHERGFGAKQAQ